MYRSIVGVLISLVFVAQFSYASAGVHHKHRHMAHPMQKVVAVVDINHASADELSALHGLGVKKAQRIVAYRKMHGGFKEVAALTQVKGISAKLLARLQKQNPGKFVARVSH